MPQSMETLAQHENIQLEKALRLHWKKYEQGPTSSTKVKLGRPLLLGSEISGKVIKYLHAI